MQLSCQLWISMLSTQRGMTLRYYGYSAIQMLARANCRNSQQHGNWKFCSFPAHLDTVHTADPYTYTFTYSKPKINWVKINNFEVFFLSAPNEHRQLPPLPIIIILQSTEYLQRIFLTSRFLWQLLSTLAIMLAWLPVHLALFCRSYPTSMILFGGIVKP